MNESNDDFAAHLESEGLDLALRTAVGFMNSERSRGILSKTDRDYLAGGKDYKHEQSELNRKQEIRQRIENSLKDFTIIVNYIDAEQKEKIFSAFEEDELEDLFSLIVAFMYEGIGRDIDQLEEIIKSGLLSDISLGPSKPQITDVKSVSVDIDIQMEPDIDEAYDRFNQGKVLLPEEIGLLVRHGRLSSEEIQELDRSDPMDLPAKYERGRESMKKRAEQSDETEFDDRSSQDTK